MYMESIRLESLVFDVTTVHILHSIITRNVIPSMHGIVAFTFHTIYHSHVALFILSHCYVVYSKINYCRAV